MNLTERRLEHRVDSAAVLPALVAALLITTLWPVDVTAECAMEKFERRRLKMVTEQIAARGVRNKVVLEAMEAVPRHCFVPRNLQHRAYRDTPLPIGHGQTISQPYIVAVMSDLLALEPGQRVLEVGTGSGYQAAVLAEMGVEVYSIEIVAPLGEKAKAVLKEMAGDNVHVKIGDGYKGWPDKAPFDGIIVTCAPTHIPEPLKEQLAEMGRLVIPVGSVYGRQQLYLLRKIKGRIKEEKIFDVRFVPMVDLKGKSY